MAQFLKEERIVSTHYSKEIKEALHKILEISTLENKHHITKLYTLNEIFDAVLEYAGLVDCGSMIRNLILEIYEIDLNKVEE